MQFKSLQSVEQYLEQIPRFQAVGATASNFDLSRFRKFCSFLGDPQKSFPSIHVAGTNGKGSTCNILGTVFQKSGFKVGVFTSPHIVSYKERFKIGDRIIPDELLISFFQEYADQIEQHKLTYFEISTALAFWWFARSKVDIAVIEVGLGGRLDATNIIDPLVSVITSISLDHTDILGDTIEEIAREKGGVIKQGRAVVIGDLPQEARDEIFQLAEQNDASVNTINETHPRFCAPGHYQVTIDNEKFDIRTNLAAPIQAKNIAIAWQVIKQIRDEFNISNEQFVEALQQVDLGYGRFEKLIPSQPWFFDGGHNVEAIKTLKQSLETVGSIDRATLVLSILRDKIRPEVMTEFSEFKNIYYYQLNLERAATFDDIKQWLPQAIPFPDNSNQHSILEDFDSELVIFSGSFYFYDTVRGWVLKLAKNQ